MRKIAALPAVSLRLLAELVAELAAVAEARERDQAERSAELVARRARLDSLAALVAQHLATGTSLTGAVRLVANESGERAETVEANYTHALRQAQHQAREERRALMLRLARRGWSNGEIARHLGCSPQTVTREIGRVFRRKILRPKTPMISDTGI